MPATVQAITVPATANSAFTLAARRDRRALSVYNATTGDLYVKLGTGASSTSFTVKLVAGGFFELDAPLWTSDVVTAACSVTAGAVHVTEVT